MHSILDFLNSDVPKPKGKGRVVNSQVEPFKIADTQDDDRIEVLHKDEGCFTSTADALSVFLRLRPLVFSLVALELHSN